MNIVTSTVVVIQVRGLITDDHDTFVLIMELALPLILSTSFVTSTIIASIISSITTTIKLIMPNATHNDHLRHRVRKPKTSTIDIHAVIIVVVVVVEVAITP
jgi:hypothetical protein